MEKDSLKKHGGARAGAGRKKSVAARKPLTIRLPVELLEWLGSQPDQTTRIIETAIRREKADRERGAK